MQKKEIGYEHLSPEASYPVGWSSSGLIRGPVEVLARLPNDGLSSMKSGVPEMFSHVVSLFSEMEKRASLDLLPSLFYTCVHSLPFVHVQGQSLRTLIFVPSVQSRNWWGWFDKAAEYGSVRRWALSGRVVWIISPRYSGFSYQFTPIPVLPLYSGGIMDLPRTKLSSAAPQQLFCALRYRAWATALLGLGLQTL